MGNNLKNQTTKIFIFEHKHKKYNIDVEKLTEILNTLNFEFNKIHIESNENFKKYLKAHQLLIEEFLEFISV